LFEDYVAIGETDMKQVGICVLSLSGVRAIVFVLKSIPGTDTTAARPFPGCTDVESNLYKYTLVSEYYLELFVVRYRVRGIPARRDSGYTCPPSAVLRTRDYSTWGGGYEDGICRPVNKRLVQHLDDTALPAVSPEHQNIIPWACITAFKAKLNKPRIAQGYALQLINPP
jgi:hypothetical protein